MKESKARLIVATIGYIAAIVFVYIAGQKNLELGIATVAIMLFILAQSQENMSDKLKLGGL